MIEFDKEYFKKPYYFFLKDKGDKISLYYSVSNTISEAKTEDTKIDLPKSKENKIKKMVGNILNSGKKFTSDVILKQFKKLLVDTKKELYETRVLSKIVSKALNSYLKTGDFKLEQDEIRFVKSQSSDVLKVLPLVVFQLVPGSSIATPFIVKLAEKAKIKLTSELPEKYKQEKKVGGEIDELIDADGSFSNSAYPILDRGQHTHWTQDMRAALIRMAGGGFPYKTRIYFGESDDKKNKIEEENFEDAYGYEEMDEKNVKTFTNCIKVFKNLDIKDPFERYERCMSFGFDPELDEEGKQRIVELQKDKMKQMIDELLLDKKTKSKDVVNKKDSSESVVAKILQRNLESIKKLADKEGIDVNKLMKHLKKGE